MEKTDVGEWKKVCGALTVAVVIIGTYLILLVTLAPRKNGLLMANATRY